MEKKILWVFLFFVSPLLLLLLLFYSQILIFLYVTNCSIFLLWKSSGGDVGHLVWGCRGQKHRLNPPWHLASWFFFLTLVLWPHHLVPFLQLNYQRNTMFTNPVQMLNISQSIKKKERPCNTILRPESTTPHYINPNMSWNVATFPQFPLWADIDPSLFLLFFALKSLVIFFILYIPKHFKNLALI